MNPYYDQYPEYKINLPCGIGDIDRKDEDDE